MSYSVEYTDDAIKQLRKMDRFTRTMILNWISKHLDGTDYPFFQVRRIPETRWGFGDTGWGNAE